MKQGTNKNNLENKAFIFSVKLIRFIDAISDKDFALRSILSQLVRSATSIGANIAEAQGGISRKDFTLFFTHAFKSAIETEYWLKLLKRAKNIKTDCLLLDCQELIKILNTSLKTLKIKS